MLKLQPPIFLSNHPLKVEVLSSPSFLKIWLEVQPLPPAEKGGGCAHYDTKSHLY